MNGREIKFRVWDGERMWHPGEWRKGHPVPILCFTGDQGIFNEDGERTVREAPGWKFMQYTGLTDAYGQEIYEGDVVEGQDVVARKNVRGAVKYLPDEGAYVVSAERGVLALADLSRRKVIGNIHQNPELLNQ